MAIMLIRGDARLIPLRDGCVDCCVTSPPYWGLRDYGTASWDGGDPACDHLGPPMRTNNKPSDATRSFHGGTTRANEFYRDMCGKCGAQRIDRQLGLEATPEAYVAQLVAVFREVRRVLRDDGTLWLNLGDSYAHSLRQSGSAFAGEKQNTNQGSIRGGFKPLIGGYKEKDLIGIPWRVAFALQADGWYLRSDIIWHKPNPMPESVTDRPTKAHEYLFLLSKSERYFYDADAIREAQALETAERYSYGFRDTYADGRVDAKGYRGRYGGAAGAQLNEIGRNKRSVWTVNSQSFTGAHFATFPEALIEPCILAGCPMGGLVLDTFVGSGTTVAVAERLSRRAVGLDLSYQDLAKERTAQRGLRFDEASA